MTETARSARARLADWVAHDLAEVLPRWLPSQRWFGGKSRPVAAASVEELAWLPSGEPPMAIVVVRVAYADAPEEFDHYALVIGLVERQLIGAATTFAEAIAGGPGAVVECGAAAVAVQVLLQALVNATPIAGDRGGEILAADQAVPLAETLRTPPTIRPIGHEQSNTSVKVGGAHVFKLIRRLQEGEHPQLEIGRFLRRTSFRAAPPLEGSLTYRAADGRGFALGVVEGWVDNDGDGWKHVVDRLESGARAGAAAAAIADDFNRLGITTADFHLAMASDPDDSDFAPAPVLPDHRTAWRNQVLDQTRRAISLVERVELNWPEPLRARGRALIAARARLEQRVASLDTQAQDNGFHIIRIHGDFHLGQTLKTPGGYALIDFEGEPLKPIAERRSRQCALKDVAGMLRSIEYAAAYVRARVPGAPAASLSTAPLRRTFVASYVAESRRRGASYLPAAWAAVDGLCSLFELEKALYELDYEVNNRPDWIHIPLGAVIRLVGAGP